MVSEVGTVTAGVGQPRRDTAWTREHPRAQDPSPELGCAGVGSPGSRQSRAPGDLSPQGLAGCWQGLAEGTGPLTLHLGAPPLPTWPSRPGKE